MPTNPRDHAAEQFCYLTTTGRVSGAPFAFAPDPANPILYLLAGGGERADWVKNLRRDPAVAIRLDGETYAAAGRVVAPGTAEDGSARCLRCAKYQGWREGQPLSAWGRTALSVACELAWGRR